MRDRPGLWVLLLSSTAAVTMGMVTPGESSPVVWYAIRAAGIVAYLLLAISLLLGLALTTPLVPPGPHRVLAFELHRFVSLLVLAFAGAHALLLLLDRYVGFSPVEVFVPFSSDYRPLAVGLGTLTLYLSTTIYASFALRRSLGFRTWRLLHYAGFGAFPLATYHGILAGTDSGSIWLLAVYAAAAFAVLALAIYRFLAGTGIDERQLRALETGRLTATSKH